MALTPERRAQILEGLRGTARFHGAFVYPEQCYQFARLAEQETVEMPAVNGHPFQIYIFRAKNRTANGPVHINIHGGGWVNPHQINDALYSAWLADAIRGVVVDVDYSLSDIAPWPTAFYQCYETGRFVAERCAAWGCDPGRISIGGYSAGGSLATGAAMKAAQTGEYTFCLLVNGYGPVDLKTDPADKPGRETRSMPADRERYFTELYLDGDESLKSDPFVSPALAPDGLLAGLPRTLICSAGECDFRFENEAFGQRLASLGVEVTMRRFLGACHGFIPHFMQHWEDGARLIARSILGAGVRPNEKAI